LPALAGRRTIAGMMTCPSCAAEVLVSQARCPSCGFSLANVRSVRDAAEARHDRARQRRWIGHGVVGIVTVLAISTLFSPLDLLWNALGALLTGFPMGYLISRLQAGRMRGTLIGALVCAAVFQVLVLVQGGGLTVMSLLAGLFSGAVPGFIIGMHCELDR